MKIMAAIVEYNPFHLGHHLHLEKSKQQNNVDATIAVMSGNFVQRGEPAVVDKWVRTKMALLNGVDLVLELPVLYATASAEYFARGAVKLLHDTGIVDILSFGSEVGELPPLQNIADLLSCETPEFSAVIQKQLAKGVSYQVARASALESLLPNYASVFSSPNNILGIEYLKALKHFHSDIKPFTMKREGGGYHDDNLSQSLASASAIRKGVSRYGFASVLEQIPANARDIFAAPFSKGLAAITLDSFSAALCYQLRRITPIELKEVLEVSEGLENRIGRCADHFSSTSELALALKTKRYALSKIQRILIHILLDIKTSHMTYFNQNGYSPYIRVLGFRKEKEWLLKKLKAEATVPLLGNLKYANKILDEKGKRMLELETRASDIYFCASPHANCRSSNQDYTRPLVIIP